MVLTDTHTHQYYEQDAEILKDKMQRCFDNEVKRLFLPNVDVDSIAMIDGLVKGYPDNCFAMMGLHPCDVKEGYETQLDTMELALKSRNIYAIGEIGIDLYWDKTTLALQEAAFERQIRWAKSLDLAIVIHCRDAFDEVFKILEKHADRKLRGIFHCFTGNLDQAKRIIDLGFFLGIGGVVTYKNSGLGEVVSNLKAENIVLETDSPYLTPVPFRGKPNESSNLIHIAQKVADLHKTDLVQLANITTENSRLIFGI